MSECWSAFLARPSPPAKLKHGKRMLHLSSMFTTLPKTRAKRLPSVGGLSPIIFTPLGEKVLWLSSTVMQNCKSISKRGDMILILSISRNNRVVYRFYHRKRPLFSALKPAHDTAANGNYMLEVAIALPDVVFGFGSGWRMAVLTDKINDGGKVRLKITVDE